MPSDDLASLHAFAMKDFETELAEAVAAYHRADRDGDWNGRLDSYKAIVRTKADMLAAAAIANGEAAAMQPPPAPAPRDPNLPSPDEAAAICGVDHDTYNSGVDRLLWEKANGRYRDGGNS